MVRLGGLSNGYSNYISVTAPSVLAARFPEWTEPDPNLSGNDRARITSMWPPQRFNFSIIASTSKSVWTVLSFLVPCL